MKHLKLFENFNDEADVECTHCYHAWYIEPNDDRPYWCHNCGYDNKDGNFYYEDLEKWREGKKSDLPFDEEKISENEVIRTFKQDTDSGEFKWHRDREDRLVESIGETDWKVQMDNEIPIVMEQPIQIPKETYHRVIKGSGDLTVRIKKIH